MCLCVWLFRLPHAVLICCLQTCGLADLWVCCLQLGVPGQAGLGRAVGMPGADIAHLSAQEVDQLALLRQLQLNGSLQANFGTASASGPTGAFGSVSSAPGASFRAPSPLAVGGNRTTSPAFGNSFGGGTVSPAYSTTSLPGVLGLQSRPASAFGQSGIAGGLVAADPVIRRPSPTTSIASHASKQGGSSAVLLILILIQDLGMAFISVSRMPNFKGVGSQRHLCASTRNTVHWLKTCNIHDTQPSHLLGAVLQCCRLSEPVRCIVHPLM